MNLISTIYLQNKSNTATKTTELILHTLTNKHELWQMKHKS